MAEMERLAKILLLDPPLQDSMVLIISAFSSACYLFTLSVIADLSLNGNIKTSQKGKQSCFPGTAGA